MRLLLCDTATPWTSVAVVDGGCAAGAAVVDGGCAAGAAVVDGPGTWHRRQFGATGHVEACAQLIREVLSDAAVPPGGLDAIVCGVGPGPFTGLRVGVVTAVMMGQSLGIPVLGLCSHDILAAGVLAGGHPRPDGLPPLCIVTDARRREVYWAEYSGWTRVAGPSIAPLTPATEITGPMDVRHAVSWLRHHAAATGQEWGPALLATWARDVTTGRAPQLGAPDSAGGSVPAGLLPPRPLYLRRPHVAEPGPAPAPAPGAAPEAEPGAAPSVPRHR